MKKIYDYSINESAETKKQFENCYSEKFVSAAALMPDAHPGYVAPIGSVLITKNVVVPAWVGFDIGCGVIALRLKGKNILNKIKKNTEGIYSEVNKKVPMGVGETNKKESITERTKKEFSKLIENFQKKEYDKEMLNFLKNAALNHIGTLGGGNHFIEIGACKNEAWLIIHSGSRGIGHRVAKRYMIKASSSEKNYEKTSPLNTDSRIGKEYLNILEFGLSYALLNRLEMSYRVIEAVESIIKEKIKAELWVNKNHNHALRSKEGYIHRKGATPAEKRERGVIPANMRDGSFLVVGLGNKEFLNSSSHGAGRAMSRAEAKKNITMDRFRESMKEIKSNITEKILDEAPDAYKNIYEVMDAQKKSVKIVKHIIPIINWKGQ